MVYKVEVTNDPNALMSIVVNEKLVLLRSRWNGSKGLFMLDIEVAQDGVKATGIPVTTGLELISYLNLGIGKMVATGVIENGSGALFPADSSRSNYGVNYFLYIETGEEEVA